MQWSVVQKKAIQADGSLLFPERLTKEFLDQAKRTMGSYVFANQYQNEIIPEGEQTFQKSWIRYYSEIPSNTLRFAFIDPAISQADGADYTALVVVAVDERKNWYVEHSRHARLTPSQIIDLGFATHDRFGTVSIGVESVAYQQALIYMFHEEMQRRAKLIPVTEVKRGSSKTKEMRILGLVPRFEWGSLMLAPHQYELEVELAQFPRGAHDDILDALASIEDIVYYPTKLRGTNEEPAPNDPRYESWYRQQLHSGRHPRGSAPGEGFES